MQQACRNIIEVTFTQLPQRKRPILQYEKFMMVNFMIFAISVCMNLMNMFQIICSCRPILQEWSLTFALILPPVWIYYWYSYSRSEATEEVLSRGYLNVCLSVRNIVTVTFIKMSFQLEFLKISNQIATFDLSRISRTSEGGRPNAPKIATTTEYCPWVGPSVGLPCV